MKENIWKIIKLVEFLSLLCDFGLYGDNVGGQRSVGSRLDLRTLIYRVFFRWSYKLTSKTFNTRYTASALAAVIVEPQQVQQTNWMQKLKRSHSLKCTNVFYLFYSPLSTVKHWMRFEIDWKKFTRMVITCDRHKQIVLNELIFNVLVSRRQLNYVVK